MKTWGHWVAIAAMLVVWAGPAAAVTDADRCEAAKLKEAGKYGYCRVKAESKAVKKGGAPDYTQCDTKFSDKWSKAETKAGPGVCPSEGDEGNLQGQVTADADWLVLKLAGVRFIDNGDGTVTDTQTGLMWEMKDAMDGTPVNCPGGVTCANPHDADNFYSWSAIGSDPDGSAFTSFLAKLNDCQDDGTNPPSGLTGGFAGRCDWRIPTIVELQSILSAPFPCGVGACIDPIFGDTALGFYWSSASFAGEPQRAWLASFDHGLADPDLKVLPFFVRAVRGGL